MRIASRRYCFSEMSEEHLPRADHHEAMKKNWFHFWKPLRDAHLACFSRKRNQIFFMASWLIRSWQTPFSQLSSPDAYSHPRLSIHLIPGLDRERLVERIEI